MSGGELAGVRARKKVLSDSELEEVSVIRKLRIPAADGKSYHTPHYHLAAKVHAESAFEKYRIVRDRLFESGFDRMVKATRDPEQAERQPEGKGRGKTK